MVIRVSGPGRETEARQPEQTAIATPFRLFEDMFNNWAARSVSTRERESWKPAVDILEKDSKILIRTELPGITENDFDLKIDGKTLTIQAEKKMESEDSGFSYHRVESSYGTFSRSFDLPDTVDTEKIHASYDNGVLTVSIPQKPEVKPRSIKISVGKD